MRGDVADAPLGSYDYAKRRKNGALVPTTVQLFALAVTEELATWPEHDERERRWFSLEEAAAAVEEPELRSLLRSLGDVLCQG